MTENTTLLGTGKTNDEDLLQASDSSEDDKQFLLVFLIVIAIWALWFIGNIYKIFPSF